jgi:hypothetical protein
MTFHRKHVERELCEQGKTPQEARYAAMRQFGNATRMQERSHEAIGFRMETVAQDLRSFPIGWPRCRCRRCPMPIAPPHSYKPVSSVRSRHIWLPFPAFAPQPSQTNCLWATHTGYVDVFPSFKNIEFFCSWTSTARLKSDPDTKSVPRRAHKQNEPALQGTGSFPGYCFSG